MKPEKPSRYIIVGAGAVGIPVGGRLARAGCRVEFVTRPSKIEALRRGVRVRQEGEEITVMAEAVAGLGELTPESGDVVLITTKSQATREAVEEIASVYSKSVPVVCLQNGVRNEEVAAELFENVYAGLVYLSAVQLDPEEITLPRGRWLAIGCYPAGVDALAANISDDLARAGFDALTSAHVMTMKWGKLVANLNNATHAITGLSLEEGAADPSMRRLMLAVREEGLRVLDAAGIEVEPPAGEPSPIRIRKMTESLKEPPGPAPASAKTRTYASMWQDLHLGRKTSEASYLNGDIVALGQKHNVPTPFNSALIRIIDHMMAAGLKPGIYTPTELHSLIESGSAR